MMALIQRHNGIDHNTLVNKKDDGNRLFLSKDSLILFFIKISHRIIKHEKSARVAELVDAYV